MQSDTGTVGDRHPRIAALGETRKAFVILDRSALPNSGDKSPVAGAGTFLKTATHTQGAIGKCKQAFLPSGLRRIMLSPEKTPRIEGILA